MSQRSHCTYRFLLDNAPVIGPRDHILIVTSAITAPFQHALAIAELGVSTGATITSVGAHIATSREPLVQEKWTTAEWLQEVRSTVWSMQQLCLALEDADPENSAPSGDRHIPPIDGHHVDPFQQLCTGLMTVEPGAEYRLI